MNSIYSYCKGESHILSEKPCQDYAYAASSDTLSMAIVSDGHGGERYSEATMALIFLLI